MDIKKELHEEINKPKRYVVTADFYVWASSDEEAKLMAENSVNELKKLDDNNASVVSVHELGFAERNAKKVW